MGKFREFVVNTRQKANKDYKNFILEHIKPYDVWKIDDRNRIIISIDDKFIDILTIQDNRKVKIRLNDFLMDYMDKATKIEIDEEFIHNYLTLVG